MSMMLLASTTSMVGGRALVWGALGVGVFGIVVVRVVRVVRVDGGREVEGWRGDLRVGLRNWWWGFGMGVRKAIVDELGLAGREGDGGGDGRTEKEMRRDMKATLWVVEQDGEGWWRASASW